MRGSAMPGTRWIAGTVVLTAALAVVLVFPPSLGARAEGLAGALADRALGVLLIGAAMCVFRLLLGPTGADRMVAVDIFGVLIVGICAVLALALERSWYIDIGIAWALQSFIGALAISKHLEGKGLDR